MKEKLQNEIYKMQRIPFFTFGFVAINVIMYLIMSFNGGSENPWTLIYYGAKVNELIVIGQWWRLITPAFLHIGLSHLLFNTVIIYFLGSELEMIIGHFRYSLLYLFSALLGNTASFALNNSISAGASTAVFGLFASTIVLAKLFPYHSGIQRLSKNYITLIIINFVFGMFSGSVDNAGHFGGLLGGYLFMYILSSKNAMNNPMKKRIIVGLGYLTILIVLITIGYLKIDLPFF